MRTEETWRLRDSGRYSLSVAKLRAVGFFWAEAGSGLLDFSRTRDGGADRRLVSFRLA